MNEFCVCKYQSKNIKHEVKIISTSPTWWHIDLRGTIKRVTAAFSVHFNTIYGALRRHYQVKDGIHPALKIAKQKIYFLSWQQQGFVNLNTASW